MSEQARGQGGEQSREQGAGRGSEGLERSAGAPEAEREAEPLKRHGDALEAGTGNRHGVHRADTRPDACG